MNIQLTLERMIKYAFECTSGDDSLSGREKTSYDEIEEMLNQQVQVAPMRAKEMAAARAELLFLREL